MAVVGSQVRAPIEFDERHSDLRVKERYSDMIFFARASGVKAESSDDLEMFGRGMLQDREDEGKFGH